MTKFPSLETMSPYEWVEAMRVFREELVDDAASILDVRTRPAHAAPALQELLDRYQRLDTSAQFSEEMADGEHTIEVRDFDDALVFWVYPTQEYETLVYTRYDYWWFDHRGLGPRTRRRHEIHCAAIMRVVELLPWANDDDLLELAAIEMGSRAGE